MLQACKLWQSKLKSFWGCQAAALGCKRQVLLQGQQVPGIQCSLPCMQWHLCRRSTLLMSLQVLPPVQVCLALAAQQMLLQLQARRATAAAAPAA